MEMAEQLICEIEESPRGSRAEQAANDLLREFCRGYPVERLRSLLFCRDADAVSMGTWLASELGERNKPVLADVLRLLDHPSKKVRFWALDCLFWASFENGFELAKGVTMMDDVEPSIRWKATDLLTRLSAGQLNSALRSLRTSDPSSGHVQGIEFLLSQDAHEFDAVISSLNSGNPQLRKYGLIAATRLHERAHEALGYAASIDDPDIQSFVRTKLGAST